MAERAYRPPAWSVAHECGHHYWVDSESEPEQRDATHHVDRDRTIPTEDIRGACEVADRHWPFVLLLRDLGLELVVVHVGTAAYLGVHCASAVEARRKTIDIFRALKRRPKLARALNRELGQWRARKLLSGQHMLFWPAIELRQMWKN